MSGLLTGTAVASLVQCDVSMTSGTGDRSLRQGKIRHFPVDMNLLGAMHRVNRNLL